MNEPVFVIVSAAVFLLYLQVGTFVFLKNPLSSLYTWFFIISGYLAVSAILFSVIAETGVEKTMFVPEIRALWSILLFIFFQFHALLTGVPHKPAQRNRWYYGMLGLGVALFAFYSYSLYTAEYSPLDYGQRKSFLPPVFNYLFFGFASVAAIALIIQFFSWRRQIPWRKERIKFSRIFYVLVAASVLVLVINILFPMSDTAILLTTPHIFLLPWFIAIMTGFIRYRFTPPDPALSAQKVLREVRQFVCLCDDEGHISQLNPYGFDMLKKEEKQLAGRHVTTLFDDQQAVQQLLDVTKRQGHGRTAMLQLMIDDKSRVPVVLSSALLTDKLGDVYGYALHGADNREAIAMRAEIEYRRNVEDKLRLLSENLEAEVEKRTVEMRQSIEDLQEKIRERVIAEESIRLEIEEMELMMGEIHTRVQKNISIVLALLNAKGAAAPGPDAENKLRNLYRRVNSIMLVSQQVRKYDSYGMVDFDRYLELLAAFYHGEPEEGKAITILVKAGNFQVWIDQAIPLALATNEVISNLLFSWKGHETVPKGNIIEIVYTHEDDAWCKLTVHSNIPAALYPFTADKPNEESVLQLAEMLISDQLNGSFSCREDRGVFVEIRIPLNELRQGHVGVDA